MQNMAILLLDCYDSFTYNLVRLAEHATGSKIIVFHHDALQLPELEHILECVSAVIIGPGPGHPAKPKDCGMIPYVLDLCEKYNIPILGVCFGFQSLCLRYGFEIVQMKLPQHGRRSHVAHNNEGIFHSLPQNFSVVRYHSLEVGLLESSDQPQLQVTASTQDGCIMAVQHRQFPFYGVQFHPESVLSECGFSLIKNFWNLCARKRDDELLDLSRSVLFTPLLKHPDNNASVPNIVTKDREDPIAVCEGLRSAGRNFTLLHSSRFPGEWSIIGLLDNATHIYAEDSYVYESSLGGKPCKKEKIDIWSYIAKFMDERLLRPELLSNVPTLPFYGGIIGFLSYEQCCKVAGCGSSFVYVENAIVISPEKMYFVGDVPEFTISRLGDPNTIPNPIVHLPDKQSYKNKIDACMNSLRAGDSYELCLTTKATVECEVDSWTLFRNLILKNPAPYCTYMDFPKIKLIGSSPERFMSWKNGRCQFRPIKGTVKKKAGLTRRDAESILRSEKEQAENLMIVDLIRHDLGELAENVECPELMAVEEYESVFQLVSVIEGNLSDGYSGWDTLHYSVPPGSMTGAPKVRSVEILRDLEDHIPRELYSGVSGYWSIDDSGDWSVNIRCLYSTKPDTWNIGAGGAITVLSTAEDEYQEMRTKLDATLRVFD